MENFLKENWFKILATGILLIALLASYYIHKKDEEIRAKELIDGILAGDTSMVIINENGQIEDVRHLERGFWNDFFGTFGL